jgi:hypothetical protein
VPSPWASIEAQARHGTGGGPGWHGHGCRRAGPGMGRAIACRATCRPTGRPSMDMYRGRAVITDRWTCIFSVIHLASISSSQGVAIGLLLHLHAVSLTPWDERTTSDAVCSLWIRVNFQALGQEFVSEFAFPFFFFSLPSIQFAHRIMTN